MLYTKLKTIYGQKTFLDKKYPFDQYYPLLQSFIFKETKLNTKFISPYRFANYYGLNLKSSLNLFIALSGKGLLFEQYFQYNCVECGVPKILPSNDLSETIVCDECFIPFHIESEKQLKTVRLLFKLDEDFLKEVKTDLKEQSSSRSRENDIEEGTNNDQDITNPTLYDVVSENNKEFFATMDYKQQMFEKLKLAISRA
ncbi:hypothetical protein P9743_01385 [Anoxybacillus geothermalis]|nr:hypothetical protein [Anoxybacillus geothermalis]